EGMKVYFWFLLLAVGIGAAFLTFQATVSSASLVLEPGELIALEENRTIPRLRVAGKVAPLPVTYVTQPTIRLEFMLEDSGDSTQFLPVIYNGLKPDMFASGRDVIIDGEFRDG